MGVTRAIRVELAKPLHAPWEEVGPVLRGLRAQSHRALNAAIVACVVADATKSGAPQTAAYQAIATELASFREWATKHRDPQVRALAACEFGGGSQAAFSALAWSKFRQWKKGRGDERLATWKRGAPILVRRQEWTIEDRDGKPVLSLRVTPKGTPRMVFALRASRGKHWAQLRAAIDGTLGKLGDCKIVSADGRTWEALLSYTFEPPAAPPCDPERVLVLHRGKRHLLTAMSSDGQWKVLAHGAKFLATRRALLARQERMRKTTAGEAGAGRSGHGTGRRYETLDALDGKLARVTHTLAQQLAAAALKQSRAWGCGAIVIEDFGGIDNRRDSRGARLFVERFPFGEIKTALMSAAERDGFAVRSVPHDHISDTCPRCGSADARQVNARTGVFHCFACEFARDADWIATWHMLARSGADMGPLNEKMRKERELADRLRMPEAAE